MGAQGKGVYQIARRGKAWKDRCSMTKHLLPPELALSSAFGLIQQKLTPLADKWTEPSYFCFSTF